MNATVLVVDDDETALSFLGPLLRDNGYEVREATTLAAAHEHVSRGEADIIVLDVQLPDGYGPNLLERIQRENLRIPTILLTGYGDIETAVEAMKLGAQDFIQKPVEIKRLRQALDRAAEAVAMRRELEHLRQSRNPLENWVFGETAVMKKLMSDLARVAPSNVTVLLTGESGTGKEVMAQTIHKMSPRANKPWVAVNCANFSDTLLESELFGYEAGAFTGAQKKKDGLFVTADTGTLFLDEISTMKLDLQAKLLRVLEEKSIRRLGGTTETKVDVRIIAATNRDLYEMVQAGQFRQDLYHRLDVVQLRLPPLRERAEDIPALVGFFIQRYNRELGRNVQGVSPAAMQLLKAYPWPGNIRQLRNAVERAVLFADGDLLDVGHFALT
ncbi:MAG: sigma-54 dependent transcriptional regulator [Anaerolineales bacterium]|nr:sigma-54 dependent transcriptional regulator [Anaerolineales bacterium]